MRLLTFLAPSVAFGLAVAVAFVGCTGADPDLVTVSDGNDANVDGAGGDGGDGGTNSSLTVAPAVPSLSIVASQNATLDVTVTRSNTFSGPVTVSLVGLPAGVTAPDVTIAADQTKGTFAIATTGAATEGVVTVSISATSTDATVGAKASLELVVRGMPGSIDPSFAGTGTLAYTDLTIYSMAIQKDDKILLGGSAPSSAPFSDNYGAVRITTDGKLDSTFGTGGLYKVTLGSPTPGRQFVQSIGVDDTTGMITLGGIAVNDKQRLGLLRVDSTGTIDPTLALNGIGPDVVGTGVRARVFGANTYLGGFAASAIGGDTVIGKIGASGFDTTFAQSGISMGTHYLKTRDMIVQTDGKFVFCGVAGEDGVDENATLIRFNADGTLDTNFGSGGLYVYDETNTDESCLSLALLADGRIIFAGSHGAGNALVSVLLTNGTVDDTFHENVVAEGAGFAIPQADGTFIVVGSNVYVWRLLPSGAPDPTFNGGTPVMNSSASGQTEGAVVDSHQRVIIATQSAVYRYWL